MMLNSGVLDGVHEAAVGAQRGGSHHHHHHRGLKKGPWTAAEDAILIEYVKKHGEGNWNAVQKNSGLARCGKSCRLRWANHLRPNLKKGSLSPEEEKLIIELHAKFGNKWARMASQVNFLLFIHFFGFLDFLDFILFNLCTLYGISFFFLSLFLFSCPLVYTFLCDFSFLFSFLSFILIVT